MEGGFPQKEIGIGQRGIENDQVPIRCFPIYSIQHCRTNTKKSTNKRDKDKKETNHNKTAKSMTKKKTKTK